MMTLQPRPSAQLIAQLAKNVKICDENIEILSKKLANDFATNKYSLKKWKEHDLHPKEANSSAIEWIFWVDTLNFSFWAEKKDKHFEVKYKDKLYSGYWSLCAALHRAIEEGYPITSAEFHASVSLEQLKHIFRSESGKEIPLLKERKEILNSTGKILLEKFDGLFGNVLSLCNSSAVKLVELVVENFPSYRDTATIDEQQVSFYKRAQILVADIWACFEGQSEGTFTDIELLTMFADYRVPQALVYFGAMEYSEELMDILKEDGALENGDRYEVEIRGCSIWAVELISKLVKEELQKQDVSCPVNAVLLDHYLWDYRRLHAEEIEVVVPFHKTRCIYY